MYHPENEDGVCGKKEAGDERAGGGAGGRGRGSVMVSTLAEGERRQEKSVEKAFILFMRRFGFCERDRELEQYLEI